MEISELQDFVDWETKRLDESSDKELKSHTVLKLDNFSGEGFANMIIAACILARRNKIDIVDALANKIEIIRGRKYDGN